MKIRTALGVVGLLVAILGIAAGCSKDSASTSSLTPRPSGPDAGNRVYPSTDQAINALIAALRAYDLAALTQVLGPNAENLLSGDQVADRNALDEFLDRYDAQHRLMREPNGTFTLVVGPNAWPLPIPLVWDATHQGWYFDTESGIEEMINRRVGRNELDTIQVCLAIVDAQREYAINDFDGDGIRNYASKLRSDPNTKNGLYWETRPDEPPSPMGPLVAQATEEGYAVGQSAADEPPPPYHGYRYRLLTSQGRDAPSGQMDYLIHGKLIGGFAVVAYPAEYGSSGVMTFIVNHEGIVYQRDLGEDTEQTAAKMAAFNPGKGWNKVGTEIAAAQPEAP